MDEYQTGCFNKLFLVRPEPLLRHYELSIFTIIRAQKLNYWVKLSWNHQQFFWWFSEMSTVFSGPPSVREMYFCSLYGVCLILKPNGRFWFTLGFDVCKDWKMNTRESVSLCSAIAIMLKPILIFIRLVKARNKWWAVIFFGDFDGYLFSVINQSVMYYLSKRLLWI